MNAHALSLQITRVTPPMLPIPSIYVTALLISIAIAAHLDVSLTTNWSQPPFSIRLIEAAANYNNSLYLPTVAALYGESSAVDAENDDDIDLFEDDIVADSDQSNIPITDLAIYERFSRLVLPESRDFVSLNLLNDIHVPRIYAHYTHYAAEILPSLAATVESHCKKDSFGNAISDPASAWVKYGDKIYCSDADLYALQLSSSVESPLAFDHVVGSNPSKPLLVFYASPDSPRFAKMFETLATMAQHGTLRFVWRYIPGDSTDEVELPGFGAIVTPKTPLDGPVKPKISFSGHLEPYLDDVLSAAEPLAPVSKNDTYDVSLKIAAFISEQPDTKRLPVLEKILNNLPLLAPYIAALPSPRSIHEIQTVAEKNAQTGASTDAVGLYVNGSPIQRLELDLPHLIEKLSSELRLIEKMEKLGFSAKQARVLFSKYALLSAFKEVQFRSGQNENRYNIYKEKFLIDEPTSGGVVYFNDIEVDDSYSLFESDRMTAYNGAQARMLQFGQIPPVKENVHDLVFVLNLSSKPQLRVFFTLSKIVLDTSIPQQIGILPLGENETDEILAEKFYHVLEAGSKQEALAFLYQYFEASSASEEQAVMDKVVVPSQKAGTYKNNRNTLKKFSLDEPSVIVNGVIHSLRTPWQAALQQQVGRDVRTLQQRIKDGSDKGKSLRSIVYEDALDNRNLKIVPKDLSNIRYKEISEEMMGISFSFFKDQKPDDMPNTFWLIGQFSSRHMIQQFLEILDFFENYHDKLVQVRVLDTSADDSVLKKLHKHFGNKLLTTITIQRLKEAVTKIKAKQYTKVDDKKLDILARNQFQVHQPTILFNSRYLRLSEVYKVEELSQLVEFEQNQKQSIYKAITDTYPDDFNWQGLMYFRKKGYNAFDWFDLVLSVVAKSFLLEDSISRTDVDRYDFKALDLTHAFGDSTDERPLEVLAIVDPANAVSQKIVLMMKPLQELLCVKTRILVQPLSETPGTAFERFYASGFVESRPTFNETGQIVEKKQALFTGIPQNVAFVADLDAPTRWHYLKGESNPNGIDFDNVVLTGSTEISFEFSKLVVEGFVKDVADGHPIPGLTINARNAATGATEEGIAVQALGYIQWRVNPGIWELELQPGSTSLKTYDLVSANENKYDRNDKPLSSDTLAVLSLHGKVVHPRLREKNEKAKKSVKLTAGDDSKTKIHVFSIASGQLYERFLATMMISVKEHTKKTVKFWIVENFLSAEFRRQVPILAAKFGFDYQFVSYRWPVWLRQQQERHRVVWSYKVLFLDVLFPHKLDKVVFVDADQIARSDLAELMDTDLHGAPYGFPPMGESRTEMEGYRFWKQGYWKNVLQEDLHYHISALFVVDLKEFRRIFAGDRLRTHYQKLSSDPNSLANLDQDLPNNMQRAIPIYTLEEEWLWCETWCSDESKSQAKMIDLCSDPLSKEGKLERAKRLIPEWEKYDKMRAKAVGSATATATVSAVHDEL